jgi:hypothetical protein
MLHGISLLLVCVVAQEGRSVRKVKRISLLGAKKFEIFTNILSGGVG